MTETKIPVGPVLPNGSQQLLVLREMTRRIGVIQELQAFHLRIWPKGILDVKDSTAYYDHKNLRVEFKVGDFEPEKPGNFKSRLKWLDASVKFLLGTDVTVSVKQGDSVLYEGGPKTEKEWLGMTQLKPARSAGKSKSSKPSGTKA